MKKLVSIFFLLLLAIQYVPAINEFSLESAICVEPEDDKGAEKNKENKKEKNEGKEFETARQNFVSKIANQIVHHTTVKFSLQHPINDILTPPPDHC
jgi:hypothetical protein